MKKIIIFIILGLFLFSCSNSNNKNNVLRLGIIPFESSGEAVKRNSEPLIELISKSTNMKVETFISNDYTGIVEAFKSGKLDIAFMSPASYVLGKKEADIKVILKSHTNNNPYYYSIIITRTDSGINSLTDLKNKNFAFGDVLSTSGHIFPRKMLLDNGINPDNYFKSIFYSGGHDATVLAVINKKVDAGATFSNDPKKIIAGWTKFLTKKELKLIKVIAVSEPVPSDNICVRKDLNEDLIKKIQKSIIDFSNTEKGRALIKQLYKFDGYMLAHDDDYKSVRKAFEISGIKLK